MSGSKFPVDDYFETEDDVSTVVSTKNLWRRYPLTIITTAIVVIFLTLSFGMMKGWFSFSSAPEVRPVATYEPYRAPDTAEPATQNAPVEPQEKY